MWIPSLLSPCVERNQWARPTRLLLVSGHRLWGGAYKILIYASECECIGVKRGPNIWWQIRIWVCGLWKWCLMLNLMAPKASSLKVGNSSYWSPQFTPLYTLHFCQFCGCGPCLFLALSAGCLGSFGTADIVNSLCSMLKPSGYQKTQKTH